MRERDRGGERGNVREDDVIQTSLMKVEGFFHSFFLAFIKSVLLLGYIWVISLS